MPRTSQPYPVPPPAPPATLLAFDPGPHTGVALFRDGILADTFVINEPTTTAQYRRLHDLLAHTYASASGVPTVVIEDYRSQTRMALAGYRTVQLIGYLDGTARLMGYVTVFQLPAVRRTFEEPAHRIAATAAVLQRKRMVSLHARDAIAHGLAYFAKLAAPPATPLRPLKSYAEFIQEEKQS